MGTIGLTNEERRIVERLFNGKTLTQRDSKALVSGVNRLEAEHETLLNACKMALDFLMDGTPDGDRSPYELKTCEALRAVTAAVQRIHAGDAEGKPICGAQGGCGTKIECRACADMVEECGSCGAYHAPDFGGDCRDDYHRLALNV